MHSRSEVRLCGGRVVVVERLSRIPSRVESLLKRRDAECASLASARQNASRWLSPGAPPPNRTHETPGFQNSTRVCLFSMNRESFPKEQLAVCGVRQAIAEHLAGASGLARASATNDADQRLLSILPARVLKPLKAFSLSLSLSCVCKQTRESLTL